MVTRQVCVVVGKGSLYVVLNITDDIQTMWKLWFYKVIFSMLS